MQFIDNPELPTLRTDWPGHPFDGKRFGYPEMPDFYPSWRTVAKMVLTPNPRRAEKKADDWLPPMSADTAYLDDRRADWIVWLGHACFLIQLDGVRYLTDPVLYDLPFISRRFGLPAGIEQFTGVDYLLLSHDHRDHCDERSLKAVLQHNRPRKILTALRMGGVIDAWVGDTPVEEAGWYQQYHSEGPDVVFLPARHWCRRGLLDFNRRLWGSFLLRGSRHTVYFGADSGYGTHFRQIGERFPGIDAAIIGVGAYQPRYMMAPMHAGPAEGKQAFEDLGSRLLIPMHYGTYDLSREPPSDPLRSLERLFDKAGRGAQLRPPGVNVPISLTTG